MDPFDKLKTFTSQELHLLCKANGFDPAPLDSQTIFKLMIRGVDPNSIDQIRGMTFSDPRHEGLEGVQAALEQARRPFFCTGTLPLDPNNPVSILVRNRDNRNGDTFTPVQFPLASNDHIKPLLDASLQASFGRGDKNVFDHSYRRALVLNKEDFSIHPAGSLELHGLRIIDSITDSLLEPSLLEPSIPEIKQSSMDLDSSSFGQCQSEMEDARDYTSEREDERGTRIIAHLDKLNVYSQGDFFKEHVDTPRSEEMFGTLLINLPAEHEGGQLVIKEPPRGGEPEKFTTEWGKASGLEWVAFFSDCEHEVLPVIRGHRVTLTYTLSFEASYKKDCPSDVEQTLCRALQAPGVFSPERPRLCFYMVHKYPMNGVNKADGIAHRLKGRDAVLYHALIRAGVSVSFHHVLYPTNSFEETIGRGEIPEEPLTAILPRSRGVVTDLEGDISGIAMISAHCGARTAKALGIVEVTQNPLRFVKVEFTAFGNEPYSATHYGTVCMIATMKGYDVDKPWTEGDYY